MTQDRQGRERPGAKLVVWIVVIPLVTIALLAGWGALHGALDQNCQVGIGSFCGPLEKARAYVVLVGVPAVIVYYVVLAIVRLVRSRS